MASPSIAARDSKAKLLELMPAGESVQIPAAVQQRILTEYSTQRDIHHSFPDKSVFEEYIKEFVIDASLGVGATDTKYRRSKVGGALRRMMEDCSAMYEAQKASMTQPPPGQTEGKGSSSTDTPRHILSQARIPPIMSRTYVVQLSIDFKKKHGCDLLTDAVAPARYYLCRLKHQAKAWGLQMDEVDSHCVSNSR